MAHEQSRRAIEIKGKTIVRPKPIAVPDDWFEQYAFAKAKLREKSIALSEEIGQRAATDKLEEKTLSFEQEDAFTYLETSISFKGIRLSWSKYAPHFFRGLYHRVPEEDIDYARQVNHFADWWIVSRFDVNSRGLSRMSGTYSSSLHKAIATYIVSGDIIEAYTIAFEEVKDWGLRSIGAEHG